MTQLRNDWTLAEVEALFAMPFNDLLFKAHTIHRDNFDPNYVQVSSLLNIKNRRLSRGLFLLFAEF
jgi:Biotin synthase and related enzymes